MPLKCHEIWLAACPAFTARGQAASAAGRCPGTRARSTADAAQISGSSMWPLVSFPSSRNIAETAEIDFQWKLGDVATLACLPRVSTESWQAGGRIALADTLQPHAWFPFDAQRPNLPSCCMCCMPRLWRLPAACAGHERRQAPQRCIAPLALLAPGLPGHLPTS